MIGFDVSFPITNDQNRIVGHIGIAATDDEIRVMRTYSSSPERDYVSVHNTEANWAALKKLVLMADELRK